MLKYCKSAVISKNSCTFAPLYTKGINFLIIYLNNGNKNCWSRFAPE